MWTISDVAHFYLCLSTIAIIFPNSLLAEEKFESLFHLLANDGPEAELWNRDEPLWMHSGKFQGDIDVADADSLKQNSNVMYNALRNRQLTWPSGIVPYELDDAFTLSEVKLLQRAFKIYRKKTCIRFRPRKGEVDFLNIVKGHGCYSQVGKTGGKQEISLGRGCLFNETIVHELMHSLGFWHEHSRADRDEHILIRWENILPGMDSQFDIVSPAIQDSQGEKYDYRSIMHYGSSAFSRNGRNTIEAVVDEFTEVIGTAIDLSELDVVKISKLYRCQKREPKKFSPSSSAMAARKNRMRIKMDNNMAVSSSTALPPRSTARNGRYHSSTRATPIFNQLRTRTPPSVTTVEPSTSSLELELLETSADCKDHFIDCPNFKDYCNRASFYFIMKSYCPKTCQSCLADDLSEE